MSIPVEVNFQTNGTRNFLMHNGNFIPIVPNGTATLQCQPNVAEIILFGIEGAPGNSATITLQPQAPHTLVIKGHPIKGKIAQGRIVWGDNRFFVVK
jgi:hypothetical protein